MEKSFTAGHVTDDNVAHAHCMLDNLDYIHTLRISNNYCCSTATMFRRTCLIIRIYYIAAIVAL